MISLVPSPEPEPHSGLRAPAPALGLISTFLLMPLSAVTDNFSSTLEVTITIYQRNQRCVINSNHFPKEEKVFVVFIHLKELDKIHPTPK